MTQVERRRFWTAIHRYSGLVGMGFLLIAAVTGVALSFARPLDAWLNRDLFRSDGPARLSPILAIERLAGARPDLLITSFPLTVDESASVPVGVAPLPGGRPLGYDEVFLDRTDGRIRGVRSSGPGWDRRHVVAGMYQFHFTLLAGAWGRRLMGLVALVWFVSNLVGVYLTLPPRRPFWRGWKRAWRLNPSGPIQRLLLELHRASALWLLPGLVVLAFTSVAMNFFDEVFTPVVQRLSPARSSLYDTPPPSQAPPAPATGPLRALATASGAAAARGFAWRPAKLTYDPEYGLYRVLFTDTGRENYSRLGPVSLYVDSRNGRVVELDDPYSDSAGRKLSRALYPLHTGQVAGPVGVAVDLVLGLAVVEMAVTGFYLWLKCRRPRVAARRARRARKAAAQR